MGCYQYNSKSGAIRSLGICGLRELCEQNDSESNCNGVANKICSWDTNSKTCRVSNLIKNNPNGCNQTCKQNSDCIIKTNKSCSTDGDCKTGSCVSGYCEIKRNCNDNVCDPFVYSPDYSLLSQVQGGNVPFCQGSNASAGVSQVCGVASMWCTSTKNNGLCKPCTDNNDCNGSGTNLSANCYCDGNDWVTVRICSGPSSFLSNLLWLHSTIPQWKPSKTPTIVYIIGGISAIMILALFVWYIVYLVKHVRKKSS